MKIFLKSLLLMMMLLMLVGCGTAKSEVPDIPQPTEHVEDNTLENQITTEIFLLMNLLI